MDMPDPPAESARPYHHGDLRAALLVAAEAELIDKGIEGFSLRGVAKRAGVSHAAPAHHFGDTVGLLSALAAVGFRRFLDTQLKREAGAAPRQPDRILAAGLGYIEFALANRELFRLMFSSARADFTGKELRAASRAAYLHLLNNTAELRGGGDPDDPAAIPDVTAIWAMVHGLADLLQAGRLLRGLSPEQRDAMAVSLLRRVLPERNPGI